MRVLIVKLSSLGDVVHTMPAVQDLRRAWPQAQIDWVVERVFADLARRCEGVQRVIECDLRAWRRAPLSASTRAQWRAFRQTLRAQDYDAVVDLQGLAKSALVARLARLTPHGRRYALANRTEGSSYEAPTRWVADVAVRVPPHTHAVMRSRLVCAQAFDYLVPAQQRFGLQAQARPSVAGLPVVAFVHGTSRIDKEWPVDHWVELGRRFNAAGLRVALPHGSAQEQRRSDEIGTRLEHAVVLPRLSLDALVDEFAACVGVVGVDSGLSHIAVALGLPHVQIYNFDTAWRTGPIGVAHQASVFDRPTPSVDEVWHAWLGVLSRSGAASTIPR